MPDCRELFPTWFMIPKVSIKNEESTFISSMTLQLKSILSILEQSVQGVLNLRNSRCIYPTFYFKKVETMSLKQ